MMLPRTGSDLEGSEPTPIEINCMLGTRQENKRFGTRFEFRIAAPQWQAVIAVIAYYEGCQEFVLSPKRLLTLHRELRSWRRFLTFVKPSVI